MSERHTLTCVALEADHLDVSTFDGPPRVAVSGWVNVKLTDGKVTVHRRTRLSECLRIGDTFEIELAPEEAQ